MTITSTEFCQQGSHFVPKDKITWLYTQNGGRRRICEDCNNIRLTAKSNTGNITKAAHLPVQRPQPPAQIALPDGGIS